MVLRNLATWKPSDGLVGGLQNYKAVRYDLVHGWDYADSILEHVKTNSRSGVQDIYHVALGDAPDCGIIRAMRVGDGATLGSVVIYNGRSKLAMYMPVLRAQSVVTGGISSPVLSPLVDEYATVLQGLVFLGVRQIRKQGAEAVILDCVSR